jgi:micrococcal nuclease
MHMILSTIILLSSFFFNDDISTGKVISVIDGNTIEILKGPNDTCVVMLAGVDSPELEQEFGDKAKKYLEKILMKEQVSVKITGKDRKGNYLAIVMKGNVDPRVELLKQGLAWTAEKDPLPELETHKNEAQQKGKGLWKNDNPTPPWIYRRQQSMMRPKSS